MWYLLFDVLEITVHPKFDPLLSVSPGNSPSDPDLTKSLRRPRSVAGAVRCVLLCEGTPSTSKTDLHDPLMVFWTFECVERLHVQLDAVHLRGLASRSSSNVLRDQFSPIYDF
jgi:hypothetical protein